MIDEVVEFGWGVDGGGWGVGIWIGVVGFILIGGWGGGWRGWSVCGEGFGMGGWSYGF